MAATSRPRRRLPRPRDSRLRARRERGRGGRDAPAPRGPLGVAQAFLRVHGAHLREIHNHPRRRRGRRRHRLLHRRRGPRDVPSAPAVHPRALRARRRTPRRDRDRAPRAPRLRLRRRLRRLMPRARPRGERAVSLLGPAGCRRRRHARHGVSQRHARPRPSGLALPRREGRRGRVRVRQLSGRRTRGTHGPRRRRRRLVSHPRYAPSISHRSSRRRSRARRPRRRGGQTRRDERRPRRRRVIDDITGRVHRRRPSSRARRRVWSRRRVSRAEVRHGRRLVRRERPGFGRRPASRVAQSRTSGFGLEASSSSTTIGASRGGDVAAHVGFGVARHAARVRERGRGGGSRGGVWRANRRGFIFARGGEHALVAESDVAFVRVRGGGVGDAGAPGEPRARGDALLRRRPRHHPEGLPPPVALFRRHGGVGGRGGRRVQSVSSVVIGDSARAEAQGVAHVRVRARQRRHRGASVPRERENRKVRAAARGVGRRRFRRSIFVSAGGGERRRDDALLQPEPRDPVDAVDG